MNKGIIYRPQRRTLDEAMTEARVFNTERDMIDFIVSDWNDHWTTVLFTTDDVVIDSEIVDDTRIGWHDTRLVCVKRMASDDFIELYGVPQAIGFCATDFENKSAMVGE